MTERENFLRAIEFRNPEWIPVSVRLSDAIWIKYGEDLEKIVLRHPKIFGSYKKRNKDLMDAHLVTENGIIGITGDVFGIISKKDSWAR